MSDTEQMVSVPREWAENYAGLLEERCAYEAAERVQALLAHPAAQNQGEPVHMVRTHGSHCWEQMSGESLELCQAQAEEYEVLALYTHPDAGKVEWLRELLKAYMNAEAEKGVELVKLRDHLEAANKAIEHAAAANESRQEVIDALMADAKRFRSERDNLRAQLAERDALLRDALQDCLDIEVLRMMRGSVYINRLSDKIKSVLEVRNES